MDRKEKDFLTEYRDSDAEGRLNLMMSNYSSFPKIIRKMEGKTKYRIKCEKEYARSHARMELGCRVSTSNLSDPTFDEAVSNLMIDRAFETGEAEGGLLKGIDDAALYEADIRTIMIMRMDYELLSEIVENLDDTCCWMKEFLLKQKMLNEIAGISLFLAQSEVEGWQSKQGKKKMATHLGPTIKSSYQYNFNHFVREGFGQQKIERDPLLIPQFSAHQLRHTFCTRFCENETNVKVIHSIMGYSDITTTMNHHYQLEVQQDMAEGVFQTNCSNL